MRTAREDIPLLEFDADKSAVLAPDHEQIDVRLPRKAVFAFLGDCVDAYALQHGAEIATYFVSTTKNFPIYVLDYKGQSVCLVQAPLGASAAAMLLDWLIAYGVREVVSAGACGVLEPMDEGVFLVPWRALRDEGTSYHYLPPARYVDISAQAVAAIEAALAAEGLACQRVITWTTDGFYRETKAKVTARRAEGCAVVEMECAALAACARMRGAVWGEILYSADTLADVDNYDERNFGESSKQRAMALCFESIMRL